MATLKLHGIGEGGILADTHGSARRRKRRKAAQGGSKGRFLLSLAARAPLAGAKALVAIARRRTKLTLSVSGALLALWGVSFGLAELQAHERAALPKQVVVQTSSRALRESVFKAAQSTLARSREAKEPRALFLQRLSNALEKMDAIESFSLRAGLDRNLQITLVTQVPLFVLEGQGKERVLVGHKMRMMQRKLGPNEHTNVLKIVTPEIKISQLFPKLQADSSATPPLNFAWLAAQGARIRALAQSHSKFFALNEINWTSSQGFTLLIRLPGDTHTEVRVHVGESDLAAKLSKLPETLENLRARSLTPTSIDLDFGDKALIRLSESAAPASPL